ncbi:MAG: hypothetical protein AAF936_01435 [Pseudomonadota bacterium]
MLCRHGIAVNRAPAAPDPGSAQRRFAPQRIRDDDVASEVHDHHPLTPAKAGV